jgi:hypothetical protein
MGTPQQKQRIDWRDVDELAASLCEISEDAEHSEIEFEEVVRDLFERIDFGVSGLTGTPFVGFSTKDRGQWVIKKEVPNEFIAGVVEWMECAADAVAPDCKEYVHTITVGGKPKFEIILKPLQ